MKSLFAFFLALAACVPAFANPRDTVVTKVPFDFVAGNTTFPAGTYTISRISDDANSGIRIESADRKISMVFLAISAESADLQGPARLEFRVEGDKHVLTEVVGGLSAYTLLATGHHSKMPEPEPAVNPSVGP